MSFTLRALPFARNGLVPHISEETIDFHYGKHHDIYVNNLNRLIDSTEFVGQSLLEIIRKSSGPIFNNAAQIYNHDFYWDCLTDVEQQRKPMDNLLEAINDTFGSLAKFIELFTQEALVLFGSGWVWLVKNANGLEIIATSNANTPIVDAAKVPLLVCDVWEHAYYIDYRNVRAKYLAGFWQVVNWRFVSGNFDTGSYA